jgi:hypothetical protein
MKKTKKQDLNSELEKEYNKKFISQEKFAEQIEQYCHDNGYENYISAIADYCDHNNIDIDSVPKLISKQFKQKIQHQATKLNFLKIKPLPELPI